MSPEQLARIYACPLPRAALWLPHIEATIDRYAIGDTLPRLSAWLANIGHESARLHYVREIWAPAQCPWQAGYEGRADLGNNQVGDGHRFMGRGLIQITGRANYRACGAALGLPLEDDPDLLEQPEYAAASAGWFWQANGLNRYADIGDFDGVCDLINRGRKTEREGDANGYADRLDLYRMALKVLG